MSAESTPIGSTGRSLLDSLIEAIVARPLVTLILATLVAIACSSGTAFLTFRSDERVFFSETNPDLQRLEDFERRYGKDDSGLVLIQAPDGDIFTPERLQAIAAVTDELWSAPMVKRVDSPTNFQIAVGDAEGATIDQLWRQGDPTDPETLARLRDWATNTPMLMGRLLSHDRRSALVAVGYRIPPEQAADAAPILMGDLRERVAKWRAQWPDLKFHITGSVALDTAFGEASASDSMILVPSMFVALLLLLWLVLATPVPVLGSFLVLGAAIGSALGVAGYLGVPLTSVSVAAPFVITVVAVCDTAHLAFAAVRSRSGGAERKDAVAHALKVCARPVFLVSLTTAVGFFSLMTADAPPFAHLGLICGLGSVFAWFYTMTVSPAIMALLPWKGRKGLLVAAPSIGRIGGWASARPGLAIALTLVPTLIATAGIGLITLDDRYIRYFDHRFDFRKDSDALNEAIGGFYALEFDLPAAGPGGIANPDYLKAVDRFSDWLREQPGVTHVLSHADRIKMLNRAMTDGDPAAYVVPDNPAVAAQLSALYEMQLPHGMDLREQIVADHSASRLTASLGDVSTAETVALAERAAAWIRAEAPILDGGAEATGMSLMFSRIGMRNIQTMVTGTAFEFATVAVVLLVALRSVAVTAIAMIANVIPGLAAIGAWGLVVGEVGMAVATIISVTLGIVVDDTIHLLETMQRLRREGVPVRNIARLTLDESGTAVLGTSLCLAAGFFLLALSGFQINAWIGLMTGIVILIAVAFDLLFLPAALTLLWRNKESPRAS